MNKIIVSAAFAIALLFGSVAFAQTYSYGGCPSLTRDLSIGARGSDVSSLQSFLVSQNYPGSGSWMVTGYFGAATQAAVRIFQQTHNLAQTGVADASTRGLIASCGASVNLSPVVNQNPYGYAYPYQYQYQNQNPYQYQYQYQYQNPYSYTYPYTYGTPTLSSLTPTSATPGTLVTVYGSGFDYSNNTVTVNGTAITGVSSYNGTSLTFTLPYNTTAGSVPVTVSNARGMSNALTIYVSGSGYPYYGSLSLSSISPTSASVGSSVTLYGSGFDYSNNTVYVDGTAIYSVPSYNGTSLTFTLPYNASSGYVQVYVTNSRGTSNALSLSITGNNQCGTYPYSYGNCGNCYGTCPTGYVTVTALSPQQGAVGTAVTVYGSGFSTSGNSVHFGQGVITGLNSTDGRSLSFIVPSQLTGYGSAPVGLTTYNVSVTNASGFSSNSLPFTVTSLGSSGAPSITSVTGPTTLAIGQNGTWTLSVTTNGNQYVTVSANWGDTGNGYVNMAAPQQIYGNQTVSYTHAYYTGGTYTVTFTATSLTGQSTTYTATVNVTGSSSSLSLSYLSPASGRVGSQVVITGSGFSTYDNTVHFGIGGTQHVPSYNGTTIYYTIPQYISPCDVNTTGSYCVTYAQQVTPGAYQLYVTNTVGQSNQLSYTVTQ